MTKLMDGLFDDLIGFLESVEWTDRSSEDEAGNLAQRCREAQSQLEGFAPTNKKKIYFGDLGNSTEGLDL